MEILYEHGLVINESKIHIKSDVKEAISEAIMEIRHHRRELEDYIREHPEFQYTLRPTGVPREAPKIARLMAESSRVADVGPMACVAGALADLGLKVMLKEGARTAIVEDGGEIAAFTDRSVTISTHSSSRRLSGRFGFIVTRDDSPTGIATSSGKTSRALSFGEADSVTVVAENASIADAAATAVCNSVSGVDLEESIRLGIERAKTIDRVRGVIIVRDNRVGLWGKLPRIVKVG